MNTMLEIIKKRRSIRKYQPLQIKDEELTGILEAGRFAPSGGNNQTSHFLVIQNSDVLQKLKHLVAAEFKQMAIVDGTYKSLQNAIRLSQQGGYDFCYNAPTLIVVANVKEYGNAMADCACALENMMLAAASLGVGSCWINQLHWLDGNANIRDYMLSLGLRNDETICGSLAVGYSALPEMPHLNRPGNLVTYIK